MKRSGYLQRRTPLKRQSNKARIKSVKCWHDGIQFDSIWEGDCYLELRKQVWAKEIEFLETHKVFQLEIYNLHGDSKHIDQISVDFFFFKPRLGLWIVADAKPPEHLDAEKKDWFTRWEILQHLYPEYHYELYRMHAADSWRAYKGPLVKD